jgi:molecular chaperone GrpE
LAAERQAEDLSDRFRKAQIQLRNENDEVRARLQRTFDQKIEAARGDLVLSLLDSLDNLQRAISAADASIEKNYEALRGGVKATAEMFEAQLKRLGLTKVPSEGEQFNPEIHEAVEMVIVKPEHDNRVIAELRPGYKFGDRLLRPAQVRVGRASES